MSECKQFDDRYGTPQDELDAYVDFIMWLDNCVKQNYCSGDKWFEVGFVWPKLNGIPIEATEWQSIINKFGKYDGLHCTCEDPMTFDCYVDLANQLFQERCKDAKYVEFLERTKKQASVHEQSLKNRKEAHEAGTVYYTSFARR